MRPFGVARYAEHRTRLVDGDGRVFAGHLDESAGGVPRAVVVIHDFYGLTQPVRTAATRLAADGCDSVALSYSPGNAVARALYLSLGFEETGEMEDDEVVARRRPSAP